jgi:hypothetical protein
VVASRIRIDNCRSFSSIVAFLACWVTQAESGLTVTPAATTRRVPSWMKNNTYSVLSRVVSTVKKSHAAIPST